MSVMQTDLKDCPQCHALLIEITTTGERVIQPSSQDWPLDNSAA